MVTLRVSLSDSHKKSNEDSYELTDCKLNKDTLVT